MSTIWAFNNIESKHTLYRREDCMKKLCTSLREHATNATNFEKKKMLPLTKQEVKLHQDTTECYICGKRFLEKFASDENYRNVRNHCHLTGKNRGAAHSICNLRFNVPNKVPLTLHNGTNYDYHFIIKELANKFEGQFECLREKNRKVKKFFHSNRKEVTEINKNGNEKVVTISYKTKFIDSERFMTTSLSSLVDNLTEVIHKITRQDCDYFLGYESVKDNLIKYKCLSCNKNYSNKINEELKKRFKNTFEFSNNDINKFIFLLRKGVYPYEYMDESEKFNETTVPEKEEFHSNLNIEDITDADYMHAKTVRKDFEIKNLREYHDLHLKRDRLLLAVFKNFRKMCLKIYHLDPVKFLSSPGLAWQAALKKIEVKLESLTYTDILLMELKAAYATKFIVMQKLIINIWKIMIRIKNHHILNIGM